MDGYLRLAFVHHLSGGGRFCNRREISDRHIQQDTSGLFVDEHRVKAYALGQPEEMPLSA